MVIFVSIDGIKKWRSLHISMCTCNRLLMSVYDASLRSTTVFFFLSTRASQTAGGGYARYFHLSVLRFLLPVSWNWPVVKPTHTIAERQGRWRQSRFLKYVSERFGY